MRLEPKRYDNPEYESMVIDDDREEDTKPNHSPDCINVTHFGPVPQVVMVDDSTAERCLQCGRAPGVVSAPGADRFDLGVAHAMNRLSRLLVRTTGCTVEEAHAIVLKLRADDVELP